MEKKHIPKIVVMLYLMWFILTIAGMIVTTGINYLYALVIFGQYFIVFGISMLLFGKQFDIAKKIGAIFTLLGIVIVLTSSSVLIDANYPSELIISDLLIICSLIIFLIVGVGFCFIPLIRHKKRLDECHLVVNAKVSKLKEKFIGKSISYLAVYKYFYGKNYHYYDDGIYRSFFIPKINSYKKIYINPNDLDDVYVPNYLLNILLLLVGLIFILYFIFGIMFILYY